MSNGSLQVEPVGGKNELQEKAYRLAYDYDSKYGSCPQCVLAAIQETLGCVSDDVFRSAYALAGGGGLAGDGTCGALAGGIIALSCKYGRERKDFAGRKPKAFKLAKKLHDRFVQEYGGVTCRDVQKKLFGKSFNMWDAEEYREFERLGGHRDKCTSVSGNVAKWSVELLQEEGENNKSR
jgi:C_GCAxxG_C_C family probable redox protein